MGFPNLPVYIYDRTRENHSKSVSKLTSPPKQTVVYLTERHSIEDGKNVPIKEVRLAHKDVKRMEYNKKKFNLRRVNKVLQLPKYSTVNKTPDLKTNFSSNPSLPYAYYSSSNAYPESI